MIHEVTSAGEKALSPFVRELITEESLFFDIETTGLSPARDRIYCIGCGYPLAGGIRAELFLAENPKEEPGVIDSFLGLVKARPDLISFNGAAFDLPFIRKRLSVYGKETEDGGLLPGARSHLDIYREARKMKNLLGLSSYKQKSIERFLGIFREDLYSGKELIDFYNRYVLSPDPDILEPILLHNREDVLGMFDLLGVLAYRQFAEGRFRITEIIPEREGFLSVKLMPDYPLPKSIIRAPDAGDDGISFVLGGDSPLIRIPVRHGILKHFFGDPENYYYLPGEDTAVHKSVGQFVDPGHRRKAAKQNCYIKKECDYIALPGSFLNKSSRPVPAAAGFLKESPEDEGLYSELPPKEDGLKYFLSEFFAGLR